MKKRVVEIDDLQRIKVVFDPQVNPVNDLAVFTVKGIDFERNRYFKSVRRALS